MFQAGRSYLREMQHSASMSNPRNVPVLVFPGGLRFPVVIQATAAFRPQVWPTRDDELAQRRWHLGVYRLSRTASSRVTI